MKTLYLVATPIGNLEDMSFRAIKVLREVDLIAAEDTRRTGKLLKHFDIHAKLMSYYEHNKMLRIDRILDYLEKGDVALVSDAGTPALNDPGYLLVKKALEAGFEVVPIPGPSAPIAALVASGLPTDKFLYLGYLPRKKSERQKSLKEVVNLPYTLIFLESPYRVEDSLTDILEIFGDRAVAIARELTKMHEEIFRGTVEQAVTWISSTKPIGEFTLVVAGNRDHDSSWSKDELTAEVKKLLSEGETVSQLSRSLALQSGWKRREIYRIAQQMKNEKGAG